MRTISARREGRVNVGDEAAVPRDRFRAGGCESSPRRAQRSSLGIGGRGLDRNGRGARPETAERLTRLGVAPLFFGRSPPPLGKLVRRGPSPPPRRAAHPGGPLPSPFSP